MLHPRLDLPIAVIVERRGRGMKLEALEPFFQQFQQSLIGGCCHGVRSSRTHPKRTAARWLVSTKIRRRIEPRADRASYRWDETLAVHRDSAALDCRPCVE